MVFTTMRFMAFMAIVFTVYYVIPKGKQWWILLLASYVFYAFASPIYLVFLLFTTGVTYCCGVAIDHHYAVQNEYLKTSGKDLSKEEKKTYKAQISKKQKRILTAAILVLLVMLGIFKYATFVLDSFSGLLGVFGVAANNVTLQVLLPVGLSFYVFQSMGYCIDVYREVAVAEHHFCRHALYVSFFPQLLQGPIGDYNRLAPQLFAYHEFSYKNAKYGIQRAAWGFFKKLVIANQISLVIDGVWSSYDSYTGFVFWAFVLVLYAIQLYADFSGYMDIAVGCSQMLGITLDENFETPYFSKSIAEFWRKWHITLGTWFRNYVFYPVLRASWCTNIRKKYKKANPYISNTLPTVFALLIVWILIGLWHGADWSYVVYGLFHGSFIILSTALAPVYSKLDEKFPGKKSSKIYTVFQIVRTFSIVTFGYVIFRPANLSVTGGILQQMASGIGIREAIEFAHTNFKEFLEIFVGVFALLAVDLWHYSPREFSLRDKISGYAPWKRWSIYVVLLLLIVFIGAYGKSGLDQFAYFRF